MSLMNIIIKSLLSSVIVFLLFKFAFKHPLDESIYASITASLAFVVIDLIKGKFKGGS